MRMRITVSVFVLVLLALSIPAAGQSGSCNADPRWLLVTVIFRQDALKLEDEWKWSDSSVTRRALIDRCEITYIGSTEGEVDQYPPSATRMTLGLSDSSFSYLWVLESLQDICLAVSDCVDATPPGPGSIRSR